MFGRRRGVAEINVSSGFKIRPNERERGGRWSGWTFLVSEQSVPSPPGGAGIIHAMAVSAARPEGYARQYAEAYARSRRSRARVFAKSFILSFAVVWGICLLLQSWNV